MHEASGLIASTARKQRAMNTGAQLAFSFLFGLGPKTTSGSAHIWRGSLNLSELSLETVSQT